MGRAKVQTQVGIEECTVKTPFATPLFFTPPKELSSGGKIYYGPYGVGGVQSIPWVVGTCTYKHSVLRGRCC